MIQKICEICDKPFELEAELTGPESLLDDVCYPCYEEHNKELEEEEKAKKQAEIEAANATQTH